MERKKEDRSFGMYILLTIVTCGIYGIVFMWEMFKDINTVCGVKEEDDSYKSPNYIVYAMLTIITCGIYGVYWLYKQGNRLQRVGKAYGKEIDENGTTLLLWTLLGSLVCGLGAFVTQYLLIKNVNVLCRCYNKEYIDKAQQETPHREADNGESSKHSERGRHTGRKAAEENRTQQESGENAQDVTVGLKRGNLVCVKGSLCGAEIPLNDREILTVGRDGTACNLVLADMDISRRHCTIQYNAMKDCYHVTDYSSTGVVMNDTRKLVKNEMTVCSRGSKLTLGNGSNEFLLD